MKRLPRPRRPLHPPLCSVAVLLALGVVGAPGAAHAQAAGTVLPANTLPVLRGVVSGQAVVRSPVAQGAGSLLQIDQSSQRAIIDWQSFNIGSASEVRFNQPGSSASALNRIYSADPSILQGRLSANGQVILINQNGILFDRGSQVNAYSLVASTLNLSNEFFLAGLLSGDGDRPLPAFAGGYALDGHGASDLSKTPGGAVRIGSGGPEGAAAPTLSAAAGGSVMVFAPVIDNRSGVITAPDGQVILAAGSKAYLAARNAAAEGLRGFLVEVSADAGPVNLNSLVSNQGQISADRGNVTLAGLAINQDGRVSASTAALYNGSVWLKATSKQLAAGGQNLEDERRGSIRFGAGSVTATPIDTTDTTTLTESQAYASTTAADDRRGRIRIEGRTIESEGRIEAPGGYITLDARGTTGSESGRVYLGAGSVTSAAGAWSDVDFASNFATFRVTSSELKDAPDQKDGILRGQSVTVDLRKSSTLLDIGGYVAGRQRTVAEKAATGGTIEIEASGDVIQRAGATIDVSGGGYRYAGGVVPTTRLLGDDGKVYDINSASESRTYTALLDGHTQHLDRWGQTRSFDGPVSIGRPVEGASVEGQAAGTLSILAPRGLVLDGTLLGQATTGSGQRQAAPRGATLTLGTNLLLNNPSLVPATSFTAAAVDHLGRFFGAADALPAAQAALTEIAAPAVFEQGGFGHVEVNARGAVSVPAGTSIDAAPGSSIVLRGSEVDVAGRVSAPAGAVTLQARALAGSDATPEPGRVTLVNGATVSTAGLWLNNTGADGSSVGAALPSALANGDGSSPAPTATTDGGSITIGGNAFSVQAGATLDVSGGGSVARGNKVSGGAAGSISLAAENNATPTVNLLAGELDAHALGAGGSLSLTVGRVQIGGEAAVADSTLRLDTDAFTRGGFTRYAVNASEGITVKAGTELRPRAEAWLVDGEAAAALATGARLAEVARTVVLPDDQRRPTSLTLASAGSTQGHSLTVLEAGASIVTDPRAAVALSGANGVTVDGAITAHGGSIAISAPGTRGNAPVITLGAEAVLDASGVFVPSVRSDGLRAGSVLAGGNVTLAATRGSVVAQAGSRIDVSGSAATLDIASTDPLRPAPTATLVASNAGVLTVRAQEASALQGTLRGEAGGPTAAGGAFALEFTNRAEGLLASDPSVARRIVVTQAPATPAAQGGSVDIAVDANRLRNGGFDQLRLQAGAAIEFRGASTLEAARGVQLETPELRLASGASVDIDTASLVLSNPFGAAVAGANQGTTATRDNAIASRPVATTAGNGRFSASGRVVDLVGDVTINGAAQVTLASDTDLRLTGRAVGAISATSSATLVGSLVTEADLTLQAQQVYPTTLSHFDVQVARRSANGSLATLGGGELAVRPADGTPGAVYAAGGVLSMAADTLTQAGRVLAPLGQLNLSAASALELASGSLSSVSADGLTIPYGSTRDGRVWLYGPITGSVEANGLTAPPAKAITLTAPALDVRAGATIDLAGGGNLQASEFVPGSGGSTDTLLKDGTFAIIPTARLAAAPVDRQISADKDTGLGPVTARPDALTYDSVHIGAGGALPEGDYALLPARYAQLPGAYVVTLQTGGTYAGLKNGQTATLANGDLVVAGWRGVAGTTIRESSPIGIVVRPGSAIASESDYNLTGAAFFADLAAKAREAMPQLPSDGGRLVLAATSRLTLQGDISAAGAGTGAAGGTVDIAAGRIAVVDDVTRTDLGSGWLQIDAGSLSRVGGSLLLGGTRSGGAAGTTVQARASEVRVDTRGELLQAPELMLVASDRVDIAAGSRIESTPGTQPGASAITLPAAGAFVRVADEPLAAVTRAGTPDTGRGSASVAAGASIATGGSLQIDATRNLLLEGTLSFGPGSEVGLAAATLTLGAATAGSGLALGDAQLRSFDTLATLALKSYGGIEVAAGTTLGASTLGTLRLDAGTVHATEGSTLSLQASRLAFVNTSGAAATAATGSATLDGRAGTIVFGEGAKALAGFGSVTLAASGDLVAEGSGSTTIAAATTLQAGRIVAGEGADQQWRAAASSGTGYTMQLQGTGPTGGAGGATPALGGRLAIEGRTLVSTADIVLPSGHVALSGTDSLRLDGGRVDVAGGSRSFGGSVVGADAGTLVLQSAGEVNLGSASRLALGGTLGHDAGTLQVAAGSLRADGAIEAGASGSGRSGSVDLDLRTLADFGRLNRTLEGAGFGEQRSLRLRSGDLVIDTADTVTARQVDIAVDAGRLDLRGTIDASSATRGGQVGLYAGTGLTIEGRIDAAGGTQGGQVLADTRAGTLVLAEGASIDVRGGNGSASFVAAHDGAGGIATDLRGSVRAAGGSVVVQGRDVVAHSGDVTAADIAAWGQAQAGFMAAVDRDVVFGALQGDGERRVERQLEIRSGGILNLTADWDLSSSQWLANAAEAGTLVLRAAGDVVLHRALGLPDDRLVAGRTWSLALTAGADLGAARADATVGGVGDVKLAAADAPIQVEQRYPDGRVVLDEVGEPVLVDADQAAKIRTGSGSITISAGRDFVFEKGSNPDADAKRTVYTAGQPAAPGLVRLMTEGIDTPWASGGGDLRIRAGRDVIGQRNPYVNDWLRRPRGDEAASAERGWFAYRPNFQFNAGVLGGGQLSVRAGRDIDGLSAAVPTMAHTDDAGSGLVVTGGGDLQLEAGRDLRGGQALIARGEARIRAGGAVGAGTGLQLLVMGEGGPTTVSVNGGRGVTLRGVENPTAMGISDGVALGGQGWTTELDADGNPLRNENGELFYLPVAARNFGDIGGNQQFFTYGADTRLALSALDGDIVLGTAKSRSYLAPQLIVPGDAGKVNAVSTALPPVVDAVAFDGSLQGVRTTSNTTVSADLFPSAQASLRLYAADGIASLALRASDLAPALVPGALSPSGATDNFFATTPTTARVAFGTLDATWRYDVVAEAGSITGSSFGLPDRARVRAGLDIRDTGLSFQNQSAQDLSLLRADRGDVRTAGLTVAGPGRLLVQAGRDIDVNNGGVKATGNTQNQSIADKTSARLTLVAGFDGTLDLARLDRVFGDLVELNRHLDQALAFYRLLNAEGDAQRVLAATGIDDLAAGNAAYARYRELLTQYPRILGVWQDALKNASVPLGGGADAQAALALYARLNAVTDSERVRQLLGAGSIAALAATAGWQDLAPYAELDRRYPTVFADYRLRRANGFTPTSLAPIVYGQVLAEAAGAALPAAHVRGGNIDSYLSSIQTLAGSDIDLYAPGGNITVGLTTPRSGVDVGVITTAGGAIRSALSGNFNINQGKVVTAQGGDIVIYSAGGNIDAGRGAKTSQTTPAPVISYDVVDGVIVGVSARIPAGFSGSGIQTLSSDPDGQGPLPAARAGTVLLFTPSGYVDAGEAGIVSGGDLVIVAQTVLNAANISAQGASVGVPQAVSGSLASSLATSGSNAPAGTKAAEEAAATAQEAARQAAAAASAAKPNILSVEVLGFGDKNCRETDRDCFAK